MRKLFFTLIFTTSVLVCSAQALIPAVQQIDVVSEKRVVRPNIDSRIDRTLDLPPEGYMLETRAKNVKIRAKDERGQIWAMRTLQQLKDANGATAEVIIRDYPRLPIRGFMHDTGRNFMELSMIKRHLDLMSDYKLNMFQWHLVDNPGWRIECKAYPELNDGQFQTRDHGKFYTYDQIREIIAYAGQRGIMVVPEIDIPGHSAYFKRTFGFDMATDEGQKILEKCFAEFFSEISVNDCPYMHIGSDEVHIDHPKEFMRWAQDMITGAGRKAVAWDPGLPTDETTVRQLWNGDGKSDTPKQGPMWDSSMGYMNGSDPIYYVRSTYNHIVPKGATGAVLCLWNDTRAADKSKIELHSGLFSGMLSYSELTWRGEDPLTRDFGAFEERMMHHATRESFYYAPTDNIAWSIKIGDTTVNTRGGAVDLGLLCGANGIKVEAQMLATATTTIHCDVDTVICAWIGFETPARSNRISSGIGQQGEWENNGVITVNGVAIAPPVWNEPGAYAYHFHTWHTPENEIPYTDEQFYWMREPRTITLHKGNNTIVMTVPKTFEGQPWNFGFVPTKQQLVN